MIKWATSSSAQYAICEAIVLMGLKSSALLQVHISYPNSPIMSSKETNTYS